MRFIAGAFYGLIALNICVFIIMTAATFINWEDCYLYMNQWYPSERAIYFIFGFIFIFVGAATNHDIHNPKTKLEAKGDK